MNIIKIIYELELDCWNIARRLLLLNRVLKDADAYRKYQGENYSPIIVNTNEEEAKADMTRLQVKYDLNQSIITILEGVCKLNDLAKDQEDLDSDFAEVINEHFWDII